MEFTADRHDVLAFARGITGGCEDGVTLLAGQASTRRYFRVVTGGSPSTCVVMQLPAEDRESPEESYPFLNVQKFLMQRGFAVPKVYQAAIAQGMIGLEDLGDRTLELAVKESGDRSHVATLYKRTLSLIGSLQDLGATPDQDCVAFRRRFDFKLLRWELEHFSEWLLLEDRKIHLTDKEQAIVAESFDRIAQELADLPPVLVHRDFQSRNLMISGKGEVCVIDFQDALLGPHVYDLVALLRDSYVDLGSGQVHDLIDEFCIQRGLEAAGTRRLFHLQTVQRKLKDAGRFVFIDRKRGNPAFLQSIPLSLNYVRDALSELPEYSELRFVLGKHVPELRS